MLSDFSFRGVRSEGNSELSTPIAGARPRDTGKSRQFTLRSPREEDSSQRESERERERVEALLEFIARKARAYQQRDFLQFPNLVQSAPNRRRSFPAVDVP